ncbi:peptide-methionine (R)-S-oxide reductase MsrB [Jannaschia aquimarina]|nr:peptide-methionine (R)-S-oxide reductase MsrB [Jannaschia aquimarina]
MIAAVLGWRLFSGADAFPVTRTKEEWRAQLTPDEFAVLREAATEPAFSSPLNDLEDPGTYSCVGCGNPVYSSEDKFDSETGWPSFTRPIKTEAITTRPDPRLLGLATEVRCSRCGSHLGHVFDDGPPPTGMRHCINGIALRFETA